MNTIRKYAILISTLLLCGMLFMFLSNLRPHFEEIETDYISSLPRAINLSPKTDARMLSQILVTNGYVEDLHDACYIADTLVARLKRGMEYPNLYHLQKRDYGKIPASVAAADSVFKDELNLSYEKLGLKEMDSLTTQVLDSLKVPVVDPASTVDLHKLYKTRNTQQEDVGQITVHVYEKEKKSRGKVLDKLLKPKIIKKNCENVLVCLKEYHEDSENPGKVVVYAMTDSNGCVVFTHLDTTKGYSVLPIQKGFEYGSSKGVVQHKFNEYKYFGRFWKKEYVFNFEQLEHRIQMMDNRTLKQIKNDGTITVRTPQEFKAEVIKWFVLVLLAWLFLIFIMKRRKRNFDPILIATAMFLTGLCVLVMFAIQNPLTEEMRGAEMGKGVLWGIGVIALFQLIDFVKLYQDRCKLDFDIPMSILCWFLSPFKLKMKKLSGCLLNPTQKWWKKLLSMIVIVFYYPVIFTIVFLLWRCKIINTFWTFGLLVLLVLFIILVGVLRVRIDELLKRLPKGFGWLLLALFITALLWTPLGREIGGMKVNLSLFGFTFQPSEIAKYLILFFLAAFFTQHADTIIAYSQPNRTSVRGSVKGKFKTLAWVIFGLALLLGIYVKLGDMGPALVIGVTFVLLYSLVKSKVNLDNLSEDDKWKRIFTCDFALLIYGVVSFAALIILGYLWNGTETALLFACLWFLAWIVIGVAYHKQFFETAFIINLLVFVFVFGGSIAQKSVSLRDSDTVERFVQRTNMCVNTWGGLDKIIAKENHEQNINEEFEGPVLNTQVANGLWAIATGGLAGQGLGDGNPNLIPAFHTDMILSSIAEQIGWIGLLLIVFVMSLLLRRIVLIGYRVGHPFAFFFCMGVAIVTAVQFFIIALGSSGMIPLTGITVPFLSYGRVSMILNLAAVGVVLSLSKNIKEEELTASQEQVRRHSVGDYNYPISIMTWTFVVVAAFTLFVWQYYALWARGKTLVHPAYVHSEAGLPMIEYNPRIALLTKEMWAGNIYDRNGLLLATSDPNKLGTQTEDYKKLLKAGLVDSILQEIAQAHTKRYYPFAEHLFFMIGDMNTGLYFSYDEDNPIGYMAEAQHLSDLRDFDNLHDKKKRPTPKIKLYGKVSANSRYLNHSHDTVVSIRLYDYHSLVKYLKTGVYGKPLEDHNKEVKNKKLDLQLTLDAKLQRDLQDSIVHYVARTPVLKDNNLLRISVVVLDAQNGDLLTSANYPLPDQQRLWDEEKAARDRGEKFAVYSDNYKDKSWTAYTDRDLGLTYQTQPGSTAKVMTAMAGFRKLGPTVASQEYFVSEKNAIEIKNNGEVIEPTKQVTMEKAIVESSNCYFMYLLNDQDLYADVAAVYKAAGVSIGTVVPYNFTEKTDTGWVELFNAKVETNRRRAMAKWENFKRDSYDGKMNKAEWKWAWGQGYEHYELLASPLNMARIASAVVNDGVIPGTHFLVNPNKRVKDKVPHDRQLLNPACAHVLRKYMLAEAANQYKRQKHSVNLPSYIGGKTGTPERSYIEKSKEYYSNKLKKDVTLYYHERTNKWETYPPKKDDGWYMFFVVGDETRHSLAVVVRMERSSGSGAAVRLTNDVILDVLSQNKYLKN